LWLICVRRKGEAVEIAREVGRETILKTAAEVAAIQKAAA